MKSFKIKKNKFRGFPKNSHCGHCLLHNLSCPQSHVLNQVLCHPTSATVLLVARPTGGRRRQAVLVSQDERLSWVLGSPTPASKLPWLAEKAGLHPGRSEPARLGSPALKHQWRPSRRWQPWEVALGPPSSLFPRLRGLPQIPSCPSLTASAGTPLPALHFPASPCHDCKQRPARRRALPVQAKLSAK